LELQQRQATPAAVPEGLLPESVPAALHGLQVGPPPATPRPCRAHLRLHAQTVTQAHSMLHETPAAPLPARFPAATHLV